MLGKNTTDKELNTLFSSYGTVKEVYLMKDGQGVSRGCAFVKMAARDEAEAALKSLHDIHQDQNATRKLIVRWAEDSKHKTHNKMIHSLFFSFFLLCHFSFSPFSLLLRLAPKL
jgi:RNA recognition motif-containing protein